MAPPKKNEFLDASDSEDDQPDGYESDDEVAKGGRSAKRRKVETDEESEDEIAVSEDDAAGIEEEDLHEDDAEEPKAQTDAKPSRKIPNLVTDSTDLTRSFIKKNLVTTEKAVKKSGVVYMSRIPPFMKPMKLRALLEPYGKINRIFLAPESPEAHTRRVRAGGNKKRMFTEGWIEFIKKDQAKSVCELLNARTIGGKKGSYYRDDIWNLLYLKGFKWHNLTEQIAAEDAQRTSRMRAEISKTTKENKDFVRNVERAKMLDGIQAKAKKRKQPEDGAEPSVAANKNTRTFKQLPVVAKKERQEAQPEHVTRVLSKIF